MAADILYGFLIVFAVVGGFELFDRTNFSLIAIASRQSPLLTWCGGALAFVASTAVAVTIGAALVAAIGVGNVGLLRVGGGAFLIGYALWLFRQEDPAPAAVARARSAVLAAFVTVFLLELGDTTMIFQIVFVTTYGPWLVFAAGASALVAVAAFGSFLGGRIGARVEPPVMKRIVVGVLIAVGAFTILLGLFPGWFSGIA